MSDERQHKLRDFRLEEIGPGKFVAVCRYCAVRGTVRDSRVQAMKAARVEFPECQIHLAELATRQLVWVRVIDQRAENGHAYLEWLDYTEDGATAEPRYSFTCQAHRGSVMRVFEDQSPVDVLRRWGIYTRSDQAIPKAVTDHVTDHAYVDPDLLRGNQ